MIIASTYVRALEDCIGHDGEKPEQRCLVLEWMDKDLWKSRMNPRSHDPQLQKNVARSVLEALAVFADIQATHTDFNPNNVLISGIEDINPVVKVGDLGNLCGEGIDWIRLQGLAIRALEMAHWLGKRPMFGASNKILDRLTEALCIAKIKRLVGPIESPVKPEYAEDFETADYLESESFQTPEMTERMNFITVGTIRQELERLPVGTISKECIDFIESLLVVDHTKRPSARDALKHPFITKMN
ncbi:hypothetical protein PVAG01_04826 [Phlyctema vagabunda]|uniref:Protein kinase domain-containing protein n=1 Tax=Phlyctema vagabunda TaxID=108571 RepID=A0ABR4PIB7_9HELO